MHKRKQSEPRVKSTLAMPRVLAQAVENAFDGICMMDMQGRVVYANRAALAMFRYGRKEAHGLRLGKFAAHPGKVPEILKTIKATGRLNSTRIGLRKSGEKFPVLITASLVRDNAGRKTGILVIFRDLTGDREAERKLRVGNVGYIVTPL